MKISFPRKIARKKKKIDSFFAFHRREESLFLSFRRLSLSVLPRLGLDG